MTAAPSRNPSDPTGAGRGYFRQPGRVARVKQWLAAAALGLGVAWAAHEVSSPGRAAATHSPGRLASPHALWDSDCAACHVRFSAADFTPGSVFRAGERWHTVTCERCHAGPAHHAAVDAEGESFHARCANCHHDHVGRTARLSRVADEKCVRCHQNLPAHHARGGGAVRATVTGFAHDHPEFRPLATQGKATGNDKRTLKFSHGLHMTPGLTYRAGGKGAWTLSRLAEQSGPDAAKRYGKPGQVADSPVSLDCASCHSLEATPGSRPAPPADGAYFQPVSFDASCKACHPVRAPAGVSGSVTVPAFDLPHGLQPAELGERIAGEYSRHLLDARNPFASTPLGPAARFDPRSNPALATYKGEIDRLASVAGGILFAPPNPAGEHLPPGGGAACAKCHDLAPPAPNATLPTIAPVATPTVWFPAARFKHTSHRSVSCADCHPGTGAAFFGDGWVTEKEPVRIAGVESCRQCHASPRAAALPGGTERIVGGAKHACTDCHQYHNGDRPLQGLGAPARNPRRPLNPDELPRNR